MFNNQIYSEMNQQSLTNFGNGETMNTIDQLEKPIKIIRFNEMIKRSGMSRSLIYEKMRPDSPSFDKFAPRRVYLNGTPGKGPVGVLENHFEAWLISLVEKSLADMEDLV